MSTEEPVVLRRRAARVILLDEDDHVLMIHGFDPRSPEVTYWYSLGGGLDDGEEPAAGGGAGGVGGDRPASGPGGTGRARCARSASSFPSRAARSTRSSCTSPPAPAGSTPCRRPSRSWRSAPPSTIDWLDPRALHRVGETVYPVFLTELVDALVAHEAATSAATSQNWL